MTTHMLMPSLLLLLFCTQESLADGRALFTAKTNLPPSANVIKKVPHRRVKGSISQVILDSIKLTINTTITSTKDENPTLQTA